MERCIRPYPNMSSLFMRQLKAQGLNISPHYFHLRNLSETYSRFTVDDLTIANVVYVDVYDLLSSHVSWLSSQTDENGLKSLSGTSIKNRVINVKNFLGYYDIVVN